MNRFVLLAACALSSLSCCGDGEKLAVPPLPQDGTAVPYSQVLARLAAQTNTAKEEHFLNHWDGVVDASNNLERSASYLLKAPELPPTHTATIEKSAGEETRATSSSSARPLSRKSRANRWSSSDACTTRSAIYRI